MTSFGATRGASPVKSYPVWCRDRRGVVGADRWVGDTGERSGQRIGAIECRGGRRIDHRR